MNDYLFILVPMYVYHADACPHTRVSSLSLYHVHQLTRIHASSLLIISKRLKLRKGCERCASANKRTNVSSVAGQGNVINSTGSIRSRTFNARVSPNVFPVLARSTLSHVQAYENFSYRENTDGRSTRPIALGFHSFSHFFFSSFFSFYLPPPPFFSRIPALGKCPSITNQTTPSKIPRREQSVDTYLR